MQNKRKIIGERIRRLRKKRNYTQDKLCELADIDQSTLSRIENGDGFPTLDNFISIIKALKISPNIILDFIDFDKSENSKDLLLYEAISKLDDKVKDKLLELVKVIK